MSFWVGGAPEFYLKKKKKKLLRNVIIVVQANTNLIFDQSSDIKEIKPLF